MGNRIRVGIVGAGNAGSRHAQALLSDPSATLLWIADVDTAQAERLAAVSGGGAAAIALEAIEQAPCDLWCICTSPASHLPIAKRLLPTGATILIEKPVTASMAAARQLLELGNAAQRVFVVSQHRFAPASQLVRQIIADGRFGSCVGIDIRVYRHRSLTAQTVGWKADPVQAGGGVLITLAHHVLDLVQWWFGPPSDIAARLTYPWPGRGETHVGAVGRFGRTSFVLSAATGSNQTVPDEISMEFEQGRVEWRGDALLIDGIVALPRPEGNLHDRQIHGLTASLAINAPDSVSLADNLKTMEFLNAIYLAGGVEMGKMPE